MRRFLLVAAVALAAAPAAHAWSWPADGPVLQPFTFDPSSPYAAGQHRDVTIGGTQGDAVRAPAAGTVTFAGSVPGSGRVVTIATADGWSVTLTHLASLAVKEGAAVAEHDAVGTLGDGTGPVPFVELGVRRAGDPQGYVDPLTLLPPRAPQPPPPAAPAAADPAAAAPAAAPPAAAPAPDAAAPPAAPAPTPAAAAPPPAAAPASAPPAAAASPPATASVAAPAPAPLAPAAPAAPAVAPASAVAAAAAPPPTARVRVAAPPPALASSAVPAPPAREATPAGAAAAYSAARPRPPAPSATRPPATVVRSAPAPAPTVAPAPAPTVAPAPAPTAAAPPAPDPARPPDALERPLAPRVASPPSSTAAAPLRPETLTPRASRPAPVVALPAPTRGAPRLLLAGAAAAGGVLALALALLGAAQGARTRARIMDVDALLPDDADLLREQHAAHRACLHDVRRRHPRAAPAAARRRHVLPHGRGRARDEGLSRRTGAGRVGAGVRRLDRRHLARPRAAAERAPGLLHQDER